MVTPTAAADAPDAHIAFAHHIRMMTLRGRRPLLSSRRDRSLVVRIMGRTSSTHSCAILGGMQRRGQRWWRTLQVALRRQTRLLLLLLLLLSPSLGVRLGMLLEVVDGLIHRLAVSPHLHLDFGM